MKQNPSNLLGFFIFETVMHKIWLYIEFALLFIGVPLCIFFFSKIIHPSTLVLPVLALIFIYLYRLKDFSFKELFSLWVTKKDWIAYSLTFLVCALVMIAIVYFFESGKLFDFPKGNFKLWLLFCVLYPVFSAFGQEVIYRLFLQKRYQAIFTTDLALIIASGVVFSFMHVVYFSPLSLVLTLLFGLYLMKVYVETKSVLLAAILHGIYGITAFTIGLGSHFWTDMYKWIS